MISVQAEDEITPVDTVKTPAPRKIIVIDPGHGGDDTGTEGVDRTKEKDLNLEFSRILEKKLSKKYRTIMTRKGDSHIELRTRTETANKAMADLLISVHTGGGFIHDASGIGLYYHESRLASGNAMDSDPAGISLGESGKATIPWKSVQARYISLSRTLAMILNEYLTSHTQLSVKGKGLSITVAGLPEIVLEGAGMPALLIEIGQLSNPSEEKQLKNKEYLSHLADGVCSGIEAFFDQYPEKIVHEY